MLRKSDPDSADRLITYGFLVAVELRADDSAHPESIRRSIVEDVEKWWGKADVEYLGKIDCYNEAGEKDTMQYEVARSRGVQDEWRVEAIDHEGEGAVYVTLFSGPDAQQRAEEYAAWKRVRKGRS